MSKVITIEIIAVGEPQHTPNSSGGYSKIDVAYKEDGKVKGKPLVSFKRPEIYNRARELKAGDVVSVTLEKEAGSDGKEYWQWVAIGEGTAVNKQSPAPSAPNAAQPAKPTGRVTGSTYETPEERAAKQVYIVRQSSITAALKYHEQAGADVKVSDIIALAETFKNYVFNGPEYETKAASAKPIKKAKEVKDEEGMDDDVPF